MGQQSNVKFYNDFFDIGIYGTTYEESGYYRYPSNDALGG